jgi:hypothetical protein
MVKLNRSRFSLIHAMAEGDAGGGGGGTPPAGGAPPAAGGAEDTAALVTAAREAAKKAGTFLLDDWREALPQEIATSGDLASFKDFRDIPKSYIHARKAMSGNKIALPTEKSTPEEWGEFFKKIGRPDDPTAYELAEPADAPEGYKYPKALELEFRKWAHGEGLNNKQTKAMWARVVERTINHHKETASAYNTLRQKEQEALKADWGGNYKAREGLAKKALDALNRSLGKEHAIPAELLQNPRYLRAFALFGEQAREDFLGEGKGASSAAKTKAELLSDANALKAEGGKEGPYWNAKHPGHKQRVAQVKALYDQAYAE